MSAVQPNPGERAPRGVSPPDILIVPTCADPALVARAEAWGERLGIPVNSAAVEPKTACWIRVERNHLSLCTKSSGRPLCVHVDFVGGRTGFRRHSALSKRQPLARAVGRHRGAVSIVDTTAGLGADTFLLACLGCRVTAVERSPVLHAMLEEGLARARMRSNPQLAEVLTRITLVHTDARDHLASLADSDRPDVVYVDPMYPIAEKSALPQKEMRVCRALVGDDADAAELLAVARTVAGRRAVVKRSPSAPPLDGKRSLVVTGRRVRYDVYLAGAGDADHFAGACSH